MSKRAYEKMVEGLEQALAFAQGQAFEIERAEMQRSVCAFSQSDIRARISRLRAEVEQLERLLRHPDYNSLFGFVRPLERIDHGDSQA